MVEQVRLVDDQHRGAAAFGVLDREGVDGLRDEGGVVEAGGAAQGGDDGVVDAADPDRGLGR